LTLPEGWLEEHPLTEADLLQERQELKEIDIRLKFRD
jgi:exopolyphosphatase/guanosine-5'-triphosphate,3'-diphosphate pyrophosphatase